MSQVAPTSANTGESSWGARSGRRGGVWRSCKRSARWYPFILPQIIVFVAFNLSCWLFLTYLSLNSWDMLRPAKFVGASNFARMLSDKRLIIALKNSVQYSLMFVPVLAVLSLLVAIAVNRKLRGMQLFRSMYFLPVVTSVSVLALLWWRLLSPRPDGALNYVLSLVGIPPQGWLIDLKQAMPSVVGMGVWASFGYYMIIWLAGLQGVPNELYEAAQVDGAHGWQLHWYITLPLLRPTAAFILIISTIRSLQVFGEIYILTGGGPVFATTTLVWYIWVNAFDLGQMGYASAVAILLFAVILLVTLVQRKYLRFSERLY